MFRLAGDAFAENAELHNLAVYCLTEIIKEHLKDYFQEGYESENSKTLYTIVNLIEALELFPDKMLDGMESAGIDIETFIPKKFAQFMLLLNDEEEKTPDIFIEYILDKMIYKHQEYAVDFMPKKVTDKEVQLLNLIREYTKDMEFEDEEECDNYVECQVTLLTNFRLLFGSGETDHTSLTFWDWDHLFFDELGFETTIIEASYGFLSLNGYGHKYVKAIFTDVGEKVPFVLARKTK